MLANTILLFIDTIIYPSNHIMKKKIPLLVSFLWFWIFLTFFKFGAWLHYTLISPLGQWLMPLWAVGLLMSIASILQMVLDIPAGKLLDRFGYRKMLMVWTFIFMLAVGFFFFTINVYVLIASVILATFGRLFFSPGINAYALSHAPVGKAGKFMSYRDIFPSIGIVCAAVLLPFVLPVSHTVLASCLFGLLAIASIALFFSPKDTKKIAPTDYPHERTHHQRTYLLKNFYAAVQKLNPASSILVLLNFSAATFYGVIWFVVPLIIAQQLYNSQLLGIWLWMFDFAIVVTWWIICSFIDRFDKKILVFLGLVIFAVAWVLLWFHFGLLFLVFAFLATMGDELASLPLRTRMHTLDKDHNQDGLVSGIINLFDDLGWAIWPLFAGIVYALLWPTMTIAFGATPLIILCLLYYLVVKRKIVSISLFSGPLRPHKRRFKK